MATTEITTLAEQFKRALGRLELRDKRERVENAHEEIRALVESDDQLCAWGIDTVLIGSYARHTAIYPGKDVDVFAKLTELDTSVNPRVVFDAVALVLLREYGDRAEKQTRSIKVMFSTDGEGPDARGTREPRPPRPSPTSATAAEPGESTGPSTIL